MLNGLLVRLDVAGDGSASGHFVEQASFMTLRAQRGKSDEVPMVGGTAGETSLHSGDVFDGAGAHLAAALLVRDCDRWTEYTEDGHVSRMDDPSSGSWAAVTFDRGSDGPYPVVQGGPRRLWDEVESAYAWWTDAGRPVYDRFGLTVTREGQAVWLDQPGNVLTRD